MTNEIQTYLSGEFIEWIEDSDQLINEIPLGYYPRLNTLIEDLINMSEAAQVPLPSVDFFDVAINGIVEIELVPFQNEIPRDLMKTFKDEVQEACIDLLEICQVCSVSQQDYDDSAPPLVFFRKDVKEILCEDHYEQELSYRKEEEEIDDYHTLFEFSFNTKKMTYEIYYIKPSGEYEWQDIDIEVIKSFARRTFPDFHDGIQKHQESTNK